MKSAENQYDFKRILVLAKNKSITKMKYFCEEKFDAKEYECFINVQISAVTHNIKNKDLRRDYVPHFSLYKWETREMLFAMQCDRLRFTTETKRTLIDMKQHIPSLKEALAMVIYKDFTSKFFRVIQKDNGDYDFEETETNDFLGKDLNRMMCRILKKCKNIYEELIHTQQ